MFFLQQAGNKTSSGTLGSVTAVVRHSCSVHGLAADPNPIQAIAGTGSTTLIGTSDCPIDIRVGSADGPLMSSSGKGAISAVTGNWVVDGMTFYVQVQGDSTPLGTLGIVTASVLSDMSTSSCKATGFAIKDNPIRTYGPVGTATLIGNVNCDFDIRIGSSNGILFTTGSKGAFSTESGNWVSDGLKFYVQPAGNTDPSATLAVTTAKLQQGTSSSCTVNDFAATSITGGVNGASLTGNVECDYDIRVGSPSGPLFIHGNKGIISAAAGTWATNDTQFYLQQGGDPSIGGTLAIAVPK